MTAKKLISLTVVAVVLVAAAYFSATRNTVKAPDRLGRSVLGDFDFSQISEINIKNEMDADIVLQSTETGWVVKSLYDYPADLTRIREAVLKLDQLTVGDTSDRVRLGETLTRVTLKNASGVALTELVLGTKRMREPDESMAMYGGGAQPDGRYIAVGSDPIVLLVSDALEGFDADAKHWIEKQLTAVPASDVTAVTITHDNETLAFSKNDGIWSLEGLADNEQLDTGSFYPIESAFNYLNLTSVVDPQRTPEELGLTTGVVFKAVLNTGESYTATIGNAIDNGSDRYVQVEAGFFPVGTNEIVNASTQQKVDAFNVDLSPWTFTISSYNAGRMMKTRADFLKLIEPVEDDDGNEAESEPAVEAET